MTTPAAVSSTLTLRPYQRDAVDAVYRYLRERDDNPCVVIPTGGGKTAVIATIYSDAVTRWDVPTEEVTTAMLVWDGEEFVSHKGSVYRGVANYPPVLGGTADC